MRRTAVPGHERLRSRYRPRVIRLLLIGESPPANGTFFYRGDSLLFRYTSEAFAKALNPSLVQGDGFLARFREAGCYLEDLCPFPINDLAGVARRRARREGARALAVRLRSGEPAHVVCVMKAIAPLVRRQLDAVGVRPLTFRAVPFPANGHQRDYVGELASIFADLVRL